MRILITNDDGIDAPGLHAVATALADEGYEITIAAPRDERSGSGSSLGTLEHAAEIAYEERRFAHLPGVQAISFDSRPRLPCSRPAPASSALRRTWSSVASTRGGPTPAG